MNSLQLDMNTGPGIGKFHCYNHPCNLLTKTVLNPPLYFKTFMQPLHKIGGRVIAAPIDIIIDIFSYSILSACSRE